MKNETPEWDDLPDANAYECPHCNQSYEALDSDGYANDVRDETYQVCPTCGGQFQIECVGIDRWFRVRPFVPADEVKPCR